MSRDDELKEILDNAAREIARLSPNPRTWLSWLIYLLTRLEKEAFGGSAASTVEYKEMLSALQDAIRNYFKNGSL